MQYSRMTSIGYDGIMPGILLIKLSRNVHLQMIFCNCTAIQYTAETMNLLRTTTYFPHQIGTGLGTHNNNKYEFVIGIFIIVDQTVV